MANIFREKDLEDYIAQDPNQLGNLLRRSQTDKTEFIPIGRQISCETGIIDLMFYSFLTVFVVELKATTANSAALGQAMRYRTEVYNCLRIPSAPFLHGNTLLKYMLFSKEFLEINTVLIAPSFDHDLISMSCEDIHLVVASWQGNGFNLSLCDEYKPKFSSKSLENAVQPFLSHMVNLQQEYEAFENAKRERK